MIYLVRERHTSGLPTRQVDDAGFRTGYFGYHSPGFLRDPHASHPLWLILSTLALIIATLFVLDFLKVWVFQNSIYTKQRLS